MLRLSDRARGLVTAGELEPCAALALVVWPTDQIREALARRTP